MHPNKPCLFAFLSLFVPLFLNGFYNGSLAYHPYLYWSVEILTWIVAPIFVWRYIVSPQISLSRLGVALPKEPIQMIGLLSLSILAGVAMAGVYRYTKDAAAVVHPENFFRQHFVYSALMPKEEPGKTLMLIYLSFTAGIVEELNFRGYLRHVFGARPAGISIFILLSSILFSLVHWEGGIHSLYATFAVGLFAAGLLVISNSLVCLMIAHTVSDLILFR